MSSRALYCTCGWSGGIEHDACPRCGDALFSPEAVALMPDSLWAGGKRPVTFPRTTREVMSEAQAARFLALCQEQLDAAPAPTPPTPIPTPSCVVCGAPGEVEPRFGYVVCAQHNSIPPVAVHRTTKASS